MNTGLNETEPDQKSTAKKDISVERQNFEQFKKTVNKFWNKSFDKTTENFPDFIRMKSIGIIYDSPGPLRQNNTTWKGFAFNEHEKKNMSDHNLKKLIRRKKIIVGSAIKFLRKTSIANQSVTPVLQQRKLLPKSIDMSHKNIKLDIEPGEEATKPIYTSVHRFSPSETLLKTEGDGPRSIQKLLRTPTAAKNSKQKTDRETFSPYPKEISDFQLKICNTNQDLSPMAHSKSLGSLHISPGMYKNSKAKIALIGTSTTPTRMKIKPIPLEALVRPPQVNTEKLFEPVLLNPYKADLGQSKIEGWT